MLSYALYVHLVSRSALSASSVQDSTNSFAVEKRPCGLLVKDYMLRQIESPPEHVTSFHNFCFRRLRGTDFSLRAGCV